jgi:hypothetical protein
MTQAVLPDPKWLDFLKAGSVVFFGIALASGSFLVLEYWHLVPFVADWVQDAVVGVFLLTFFLTLTNVIAAIWNFFQPHRLFVDAVNNHGRRKYVRERIGQMTPKEREIIGYLLDHNQRVFTAARDGGHATTLISSRIVEITAAPNQVVDANNVPFAVPRLVWKELLSRKELFPYAPPARGETEVEPWRERTW